MTDASSSPLSGNVLFYNQPEPLDPARHGGLGVNAADKPYAFVGATNFVPLTVTEFAAAAFLICDCCGATREVAIGEDDRLHQAAHEAGYAVQRTTIEAHGRCAACREAA